MIATQPWPLRFLAGALLGNALIYFYSLAAPPLCVSHLQISFLSHVSAPELGRLLPWADAGQIVIGMLGVTPSLLPPIFNIVWGRNWLISILQL